PYSVAAALARALDTDPAGRPDSPAQLLAQLTQARGSAARERPATDRQVTRPPSRSDALSMAMPTAAAGAAPAAIAGRPVGRGYWLDAKIGSGSAGTVYRARRLKDNTVLAAKLLRAELAGDPDAVTRFLGERTTLMRLRHPHLVEVHDLVAEGDDLAI